MIAGITEGQLLAASLTTGGAVVLATVRALIKAPDREAAAYRAGIEDEAARCAEDIARLNDRIARQDREIAELRSAVTRLLLSDLTPAQRTEIAQALKGPS